MAGAFDDELSALLHSGCGMLVWGFQGGARLGDVLAVGDCVVRPRDLVPPVA